MEQKQLEFIDRRNKLLISLIRKLDLGIHILHLPDKPMFYNIDYSIQYSGFVLDNRIILNTKPHDSTVEDSFKMKLTEDILESDEKIEQTRGIFQDWINNCTHRTVWTIKVKNTRLYLAGFNHHDKLNKRSPYPIFSEYYPHIYFDEEKKNEILDRFSNSKVELE